MQLITRACRRITNLIAPSDSVFYVGCLGINNLGDDAVFEAARTAVRRRRFVTRSSSRFAVVMLGGGTLIGGGSWDGKAFGSENSFLKAFDEGIRKCNQGVVFGTGVSGVDFDHRSAAQTLIGWKGVLQKCKYIGVRGPDSLATLNSWGIDAELIGDLAAQFVQPVGYWSPQDRVLGVTVGESGQFKYAEFHTAIAALIKRLGSEGWRTRFFVVTPSDLPATINTARMAGINSPEINLCYSRVAPFISKVSHLQVFIGLKLHSTILAMCAGVPSIMIDYNPKCLDFMKSVQCEQFNINIADVTTDVIYQKLSRLREIGTEMSRSTTAVLSLYKEKQLDAAEKIGDLCDNRQCSL